MAWNLRGASLSQADRGMPGLTVRLEATDDRAETLEAPL